MVCKMRPMHIALDQIGPMNIGRYLSLHVTGIQEKYYIYTSIYLHTCNSNNWNLNLKAVGLNGP